MCEHEEYTACVSIKFIKKSAYRHFGRSLTNRDEHLLEEIKMFEKILTGYEKCYFMKIVLKVE